MNYEIIKDEKVLKNFIEWLPVLEESEGYYCCLFARSKYTTGMVHIKSDKSQLKRFTSNKERLFDKIRQLECPLGAYHQRETEIPQEALALYMTVNPRNLWKATFGSLVHLAKCIQTNAYTVNPHQEVMSEIQKSKSRTVYVDFDLDSRDNHFIEEALTYINKDAVTILQSRGGYHILIEVAKVEDQYKKSWYKDISQIAHIDQVGDLMIPVPGCTQGDFVPNFIPTEYFLQTNR